MDGFPTRTEIERCYRILELDADASSTLVDAAWRKLINEWRPDRFVNDPDLYARAQTRILALNRSREQLKAYFGEESPPGVDLRVPTEVMGSKRGSLRQPLLAFTAFTGVAIAAVLIARPSSTPQRGAASEGSSQAPPMVATPPAAPTQGSEILLVARAPLTVSAVLVADGRILLPETALYAGQTTTVPRLGATYIKYSAGENLEIEINGQRYAMPVSGPSRAKIN